MFDPRDLDTTGLLREILLELQSIRQLLEEQAPAEVTISQSIVVPEEPIKKWRIKLDPMAAMRGGADGFLRANPNVHELLSQSQEAMSGALVLIYKGKFIDGAEEVI